MSGKTFVDTSILIIAHDLDAGVKNEVAKGALLELWSERTGILSMQVLEEFYTNITRKMPSPLSKNLAHSVVGSYLPWCMEITPAEISTAFRIEDELRIGFWSALIVSAAVKSGATRILSADLNAGQRVYGIPLENPFANIQ